MSFLKDLAILVKLLLFSIYWSLETLIKNIFLPNSFYKKSIDNQVVLITGAAGGIGKHLVKNLLELNCRVVCIDLNQTALDKLKIYLEEKVDDYDFKTVFYYQYDVTSTEQIENCAHRIEKEIGDPVDLVINNAGVFNKGKLFCELSEEEIKNIFNVNIFSQMWICKKFLPSMINRNNGHIVNVCSSLGQFGAYRVTDYCSTKFAVAGFTEALRIELKSLNCENVKTTLVCPYHVSTDLFKGFEMDSFRWASVDQNDPKKVAKSIIDGILMNKELVGYPKVQFFLFLAIKNLLTTKSTDSMMIWFGFNQAIEKSKKSFNPIPTIEITNNKE